MREGLPIACTLELAALGEREQEWRRLVETHTTRRESTPAGVRLVLERSPGVEAELRRLASLEAECCQWMAMEIHNGKELRLEVTSAPEGVAVLAEMFGVA